MAQAPCPRPGGLGRLGRSQTFAEADSCPIIQSLFSPHTGQEDWDDWPASKSLPRPFSDQTIHSLCSPHTGQEDWDDWGGASAGGGARGGGGLGSVSSQPHAPAARSGSEYSLSQLQVCVQFGGVCVKGVGLGTADVSVSEYSLTQLQVGPACIASNLFEKW